MIARKAWQVSIVTLGFLTGCAMPEPTAEESKFSYISAAAERYGVDGIQVSTELPRIIESLGTNDLVELASVYREIEQRGDAERLSRYIDAKNPGHRRFLMLLFLFSALAERGVEPFVSESVAYRAKEEPLDWSKLPAKLRYLAGPAERYGIVQFAADREQFLKTLTPAQETELSELKERILSDWEAKEQFLNEFPMTDHKESRLIYFMEFLIFPDA